MIVRRGGKYVVVSESTGRRFGTYDTLAEARNRLRQIEFFKHRKARPGALPVRGPRGWARPAGGAAASTARIEPISSLRPP
jgi:hypothetical protein